MTVLQPTTIPEVQDAVRRAERIRVRGGGSKPALSAAADGVTLLDLAALRGMREYEPEEFVFTALAATPVAEIEALLATHGQYLPFDPLLVDRGATLGGVVAANTAGSGRFRYGGVRDFVIGVRFVDGQGNLVRGGGKVVKNAAGFDLPKLMVGSLGRLGVLVELSFKVFPRPAAYASLVAHFAHLRTALDALYRLNTSAFDLEALDLEPAAEGALALRLRIGGPADVLSLRLDRLQAFLAPGAVGFARLEGEEEARFWRARRELTWVPAGHWLVKAPLTPARIPALEERVAATDVMRLYSVGGNLAWLAWPPTTPRAAVQTTLTELGLTGMVLMGPPAEPLLTPLPGAEFYRRVKQALDPDGRFV
ncbi:MAG: FAD-binding protein [Anaerolineae bacterium]|nr:FAD-binding protein [Caldilineales bacterium]MCX7854125.1 FAD-binding protein [Caldilineales bacterium]MDW8270211.1 FAD-binding protein [Anaerolineae bacterium]